MTKKEKRGFTLIELLVVVLIIGILAAVAVPQYQKAVAKSRASTVLPLLADIVQAEEIYYLQNQTYTTDLRILDIGVPANCSLTQDTNNEGTAWFCDNGFRIVANYNGGIINAVYCPDTNGTATACQAGSKFQFGFAAKYSNGGSRNPPLTKRCWIPSAATNGDETICKSLGEPVTCGEKTCYELH